MVHSEIYILEFTKNSNRMYFNSFMWICIKLSSFRIYSIQFDSHFFWAYREFYLCSNLNIIVLFFSQNIYFDLSLFKFACDTLEPIASAGLHRQVHLLGLNPQERWLKTHVSWWFRFSSKLLVLLLTRWIYRIYEIRWDEAVGYVLRLWSVRDIEGLMKRILRDVRVASGV